MAQPAEAEQRNLPILRRRLEIEDRTALAIDDLAGEDETAGIDLGGAGGARASMFRAKRFITSVEIRLR
jgi:hypothetical protein